jgi:hypothetical protein
MIRKRKVRKTMKTKISVALLALLAAGCSASLNKPGCTQADLKELLQQEYNELTDVCAGKSAQECPEWNTITAEYAQKRKDWASCHQ